MVSRRGSTNTKADIARRQNKLRKRVELLDLQEKEKALREKKRQMRAQIKSM